MRSEEFPTTSESDAEHHIAAITGETGPLPPIAEQPSVLRRGITACYNLGKIAVNGDMSEMLAAALRRSF